MPWIELHQSLPTHKKLLRLTGLLNLKTPAAIGHLTMLWLWALDNAPDGELSSLTERELAQVCQFSARRAGEFLDALIAAGFLEREGDELRIHDWDDYGGKYQVQREKARERMRKKRAAVRDEFAERSGYVPDIQNSTEDNRTQEYSTASQTGQDSRGYACMTQARLSCELESKEKRMADLDALFSCGTL